MYKWVALKINSPWGKIYENQTKHDISIYYKIVKRGNQKISENSSQLGTFHPTIFWPARTEIVPM
jgi:hypothetical protein